MLLFWILATVMVGLALVFVLPPLLSIRNRADALDQNTLNVAVVRQQLGELKTDLADGKLSPDDYEAARADLEKELLNDIDDEGANPSRDSGSRGRWVALLVAVAIPAAAIPLYGYLGSGELIPALQSAARETPGTPPGGERLPSVDEMVAALEARVESDPGNLEGWQMLGRSYMVLNRYDDATRAFEQASSLAGGRDASLLASYAEAMSLAREGRLEGEPAELIRAALQIDPENMKALWLEGYLHYQRADYTGAISRWGKVAQMLPPGSEQSANLLEAIELAHEKMGASGAVPASETAAASPPPSTGGAVIRTRVSLGDRVREQAEPGDTVFILARAVEGPRMPLAIVRMTVSDLPVTVELDDSTAMSPAMALSGFSEVAVEARVSKSGQAMARSGDLSGRVAPVSPGTDRVVELTIDSVVP